MENLFVCHRCAPKINVELNIGINIADRQKDRQKDRQTDRHTDIQSHAFINRTSLYPGA
jgi:hypothetical protein